MGGATRPARGYRTRDRGARGRLPRMSATDAAPATNDAGRARAAADHLRARLGKETPIAALILGSGLGGLAERITEAVRVPFAQIPGFPSATVAGHAGA